MNYTQLMEQLAAMATPSTKATMLRHGAMEPIFGVRIGDMKKLVKSVKHDHALALQLYASTNSDAMYLAGLGIDPKNMSKEQLLDWAKHARWSMHAETTVPAVAAESKFAQELAVLWINSEDPLLATCGWSTYAGYVMICRDELLDLSEIETYLNKIEHSIHEHPNRVRYCMNAFLMAVGGYVLPLRERAKQVAASVGTVMVDVGNTACKVPDALTSIVAMEKRNPMPKKRKTIRC